MKMIKLALFPFVKLIPTKAQPVPQSNTKIENAGKNSSRRIPESLVGMAVISVAADDLSCWIASYGENTGVRRWRGRGRVGLW